MLITSLFFLMSSELKADIFCRILEKYPNPVFLCTGVASGEIFARAIEAHVATGAFSEIYGVEEDAILARHSYQFVIPKYVIDYKPQNITQFRGYCQNSVTGLAAIIKGINKPITFVLASQFPDWVNSEKKNYILEELDQIKQHHIKEHVILIDYIHFGDISLVINKLLEINPNYKFRFENGGHMGKEENEVLVAYL